MRIVFYIVATLLLLACSGGDPPPPAVRLATPDGPVLSSELDALVVADAGANDCKPIDGCCYPPSWPQQTGACSCVDATGKGCEWDETCAVGKHCSTKHPVLAADAGLPACGSCL